MYVISQIASVVGMFFLLIAAAAFLLQEGDKNKKTLAVLSILGIVFLIIGFSVG